MTGHATAKNPCPQCGYLEGSNDDLPPIAVTRPWHLRDRSALKRYVASLGSETSEWLLALYVDNDLNLLAVDTVGRGDISSVRVNFGSILGRGHALQASGFILVHNHPSGICQPSSDDIRFTSRLRWLSQELDLPLLDHCILAGEELVSIGGL